MATPSNTTTSRMLRVLLLAAATLACAADGMSHHVGAGSLRSESNDLGGTRGYSDSPASTPSSLRSSSPEQLMGQKTGASISEDTVVYPPPSAKGSAWRFELTTHQVSASPIRGRGASPRPSCARCNSVSDWDMEDGAKRVNLRLDF